MSAWEDPRGPLRTIVAVERTLNVTLVTFEPCGHVNEMTAYMDWRVGSKARCIHCRHASVAANSRG